MSLPLTPAPPTDRKLSCAGLTAVGRAGFHGSGQSQPAVPGPSSAHLPAAARCRPLPPGRPERQPRRCSSVVSQLWWVAHVFCFRLVQCPFQSAFVAVFSCCQRIQEFVIGNFVRVFVVENRRKNQQVKQFLLS